MVAAKAVCFSMFFCFLRKTLFNADVCIFRSKTFLETFFNRDRVTQTHAKTTSWNRQVSAMNLFHSNAKPFSNLTRDNKNVKVGLETFFRLEVLQKTKLTITLLFNFSLWIPMFSLHILNRFARQVARQTSPCVGRFAGSYVGFHLTHTWNDSQDRN